MENQTKKKRIILWRMKNANADKMNRLASMICAQQEGDLNIIWGDDLEIQTLDVDPDDLQVIRVGDNQYIKIKGQV